MALDRLLHGNQPCRTVAEAAAAQCRAITNDDLWSAIRGVRMYSMSRDELLTLAQHHDKQPMFASAVVARAARHVAATKHE